MSMAHSLETRVPFLDNDLVDFAITLPVKQKLGNLTEVRAFNENDIVVKREQYFSAPRRQDAAAQGDEDATFRTNHRARKAGLLGARRELVQGREHRICPPSLYNRNARIYDYLDRAAVQALVDEHLAGIANRRLLIWSLIYLENLMEVFASRQNLLDRRAIASPRSEPRRLTVA